MRLRHFTKGQGVSIGDERARQNFNVLFLGNEVFSQSFCSVSRRSVEMQKFLPTTVL